MGKKFEILLDGGADMPAYLRKRYDIFDEYSKGIIYNPDNTEYGRSNMDYDDNSAIEYFNFIKKNAGRVKTSFAPMGEMIELLEKVVKEDKDVLFLTLSSGISGSYGALLKAKEIVLEDYPNAKIEIVDSLKYSGGITVLAITASELRKEGKPLEEVAKIISDVRYNVHESGVMDDLRFLAKSGRLSAPKAFFGSLIGVQPLADLNYKGENETLGTVKGKENAEKVCFEYMARLVEHPEDQIMIITHSNRFERAKLFAEIVEKRFHPKEIHICNLSQTCGANVGPGLTAVFYYGKEITPERKYELEAFKEACAAV